MSEQSQCNSLLVRLPSRCVCHAVVATIGGTTLHCANCGTRRGRLSSETFNFIAEVVRLTGRPKSPIIIRERRS
jgi:Protein phosphatase 2C